MVHFDECVHKWTYHANAENDFAKGVSFIRCKECQQFITLQEKCALEQTIAIKESLKIQEKSLDTGKKAMIISAVAMCVSVVGLWLEKIFR